MAERTITTTGYLILGLLASQDWSAYQLAEQLGRGVSELWPSANRGRYALLTRLNEEGYVETRREHTGQRGRTVYSITPKGSAALREWLGAPVHPPAFECEALVRVLLSDRGSIDELRRTLAQTRQQAVDARAVFARYAAHISSTGGTFPERRHLFALVNAFMIGHFAHIIEWVDWAEQQIVTWPDTATPATTHDEQVRDMLAPGRALWEQAHSAPVREQSEA